MKYLPGDLRSRFRDFLDFAVALKQTCYFYVPSTSQTDENRSRHRGAPVAPKGAQSESRGASGSQT